MAAFEMWDYLSATPVTPDYNSILDVRPQRIMIIDGTKNQVVHLGDDNSEEIISYSTDSVFYVALQWDALSESDAGTIFDFYHDTAKGNAIARKFKWTNYAEISDQHTYTVRFASPLPRSVIPGNIHGFANILLKVLGRAP